MPRELKRAETASTSDYFGKERRRFLSLSPYFKDKAKATISLTVSAVTTFEKWLSVEHNEEQRMMEHIPPEQLDAYLTGFFNAATKPSGEEYSFSTFRLLHSRLDLYLQARGYACSIMKSQRFIKSQIAFKRKLSQLISSAHTA